MIGQPKREKSSRAASAPCRPIRSMRRTPTWCFFRAQRNFLP